MTLVFDTHAHLQDPAFAADASEVIERAAARGVGGVVVCGYDQPSNEQALELAARSALIFPAVGFHPHDAKDVTPAMLDELERLAALPQVVAIGEIGLDYYRDHSPHEVQAQVLEAELEIAARLGKPVSVHSRAAEGAIYEHLARYSRSSGWQPGSRPIGIMHCFGGSLEQAQRYVEIGFLVSFACTLTYPRNDAARTIAAALPLESIVVETDSPYLPPQKLRGKRNEPANVVHAVESLAEARGIDACEAATATTANALRIFGVSLPSKVAAR
ncbi:MAG: TatD family hydrolase [Dehalococcoidia bacterium]|nr:TatD family hydrolase [Dehalococcoidia bacterium]